jgi:uncharacterized protein (TIGR02246 family)
VRLNRQPGAGGVYSPSGTWGDPTLATAEKGKVVVEGIVRQILTDLEAMRTAAVPPAQPRDISGATRPGRAAAPVSELQPNGCSAGDERSIRRVQSAFNVAWTNHDAEAVAALWAERGDILHADGSSERGPIMIRQNRAEQFRRNEYRLSRHTLAFGSVRCVNDSVAVVDAKWELRGVEDAAGNALPGAEGQATLVMARVGGAWLIEAYRYNVKPGSPQPRLLTRPGYPDKR